MLIIDSLKLHSWHNAYTTSEIIMKHEMEQCDHNHGPNISR